MNYPVFTKWIRVVVAAIVICCLQQPVCAQVNDSINLSSDFILDTIPSPPPVKQEPFQDELVDEYINYDTRTIEEKEEKTWTFLFFDSSEMQAERQQFKLRATPDSAVTGLKKREEFWYADFAFADKEEKKNSNNQSFWQSDAFQVLLTVIAVITFAVLLVIYLSNSTGGVFRRNRHIIRQGENEEGISEDIFAIAYEREIARAEQAKDFRLATRLHFLQLLKEMADRNIIRYLDERTNLDYLMQLHQTALYDDFFRLTRHFEYSWYGLFEVGEEQYARIKSEFRNMHKRLY